MIYYLFLLLFLCVLYLTKFDNYGFAQEICSIAPIFTMFYGGFGTNTHAAKPVLAKSLLLSSLGVVLKSILYTSNAYDIPAIATKEIV